jgi:hypothetical protein
MSDTTEQFEGGCLCGAVRFVATGQPKAIYWCHCQSCRSHTGAPVSVFALFDGKAHTVTKGEITKFDSTPGQTRRGFCSRCSSRACVPPLRTLQLRTKPMDLHR